MTTAADGGDRVDAHAPEWANVLELAAACRRSPTAHPRYPLDAHAGALVFYESLARRVARGRFVVAHLGQSLDGRIATLNGDSRFITGPSDITHNHRMRALFDAVVVGAGTVREDNPRLTVRRVGGANPLRVVLDANRGLGADYNVFADDMAPSILVCADDCVGTNGRHGVASVVGVARRGEGLDLTATLSALAEHGAHSIFVEGGGVTVSRFLAAGLLHRLQITVAPLILGSGRMGIDLPRITSLAQGTRPPVRHLRLGDDVLFECVLNEQ